MTISQADRERIFSSLSPWAHEQADLVHWSYGRPSGVGAELKQVADTALWEAICRADCPAVKKIKAFSYLRIRGSLVSHMRFETGAPCRRKDKRRPRMIPLDGMELWEAPGDAAELREIVREASCGFSSPIDRVIVDMIVGNERNADIARAVGVGVWRVVKIRAELVLLVKKEIF